MSGIGGEIGEEDYILEIHERKKGRKRLRIEIIWCWRRSIARKRRRMSEFVSGKLRKRVPILAGR